MEKLYAGFARLETTPPMGIPIAGYYESRYADGILDPISASAIAFGKGNDAAVMISCDLLSLLGPLGRSLPGRIAKELNIPESAVFLHHTHCHTGPIVDVYRESGDAEYDQWFARRICDVARLAMDDRKPITEILGAQDVLQNMAFVRRFYMKDGSVRMNPPATVLDQVVRPACEADRTMRVIRIVREDDEIVLVNFQTHPDGIGGNKISADYPGVLRRVMEQNLPNAYCDKYKGKPMRGTFKKRLHQKCFGVAFFYYCLQSIVAPINPA